MSGEQHEGEDDAFVDASDDVAAGAGNGADNAHSCVCSTQRPAPAPSRPCPGSPAAWSYRTSGSTAPCKTTYWYG